MKSNEELIKEFEARRNFTLEECERYIKENCLTDNTDEQIIEVDDIFEYMKSLGYSTLDEINEKIENKLFTKVNGKFQINEEYSKSKKKGYVTLDEFNHFIDNLNI